MAFPRRMVNSSEAYLAFVRARETFNFSKARKSSRSLIVMDSELVLNLLICNLIRGSREDAGFILIVGFDLYFMWFDRMAIDFCNK